VSTLRALAERGAETLRRAGIPEPRKEARRILAHVLSLDPPALLAMDDAEASADTVARFLARVAHRSDHAPLSHVLGYRDFWSHRFRVGPAVLDPRPETETLVAAALEAPFARVLDLGTGSGCIVLSLLADRPDARGTATDISPAALDIARRNAETLGLADRVTFVEADWGAGLDGAFDLIVSNPPYIAAAEMGALASEVRDHEPSLALTDGGDGLGAYRRIAAAAPHLLVPGGRLLVEIGPGQAHAVAEIFRAAGLVLDQVRADMDTRERVIAARAP
jgi:release factor glutamine methyltransferase